MSGSKNDFWDNGGVWQTPNFESAERKIVIRFDGGVSMNLIPNESTPDATPQSNAK